MKKIFLTTVLMLLSFDAAAQNEARLSPEVRVISNGGLGSGTLIDGNMVITAAHCILDPSNTIVVLSNDEIALKTVVIHISQSADLAILKIQLPNSTLFNRQQFAKLASRTEIIAVGDRVFLRGFPWGQAVEETTGVVTGVNVRL